MPAPARVCHDRRMPLIDYFVAPDDATAATALDVAGGPGAAGFATLPAKGIDPSVTLGKLESLLTGRRYEEITGDPRHRRPLTDTEAESFVVTVTDTLRDALAGTGGDRVDDVAREWAATDERRLARLDATQLAQVLQLLAGLARQAVDADGRLYCWWAL